MKCDIKIMASPKRMQNVFQEVYALGLDIVKDVFFDDRINGGDALYTARKTWGMPHETGVSHRCVIQDDVKVCRGFYEAIQVLCNLYPYAVISLYSSRKDVAKFKNPVVQIIRGGCTAQALLCPIDLPAKAFEWALDICWFYPHDDAAICEYARVHEIPILLTNVSLVQHLCPTSSLVGLSFANKTASNFVEDATGIDWKSYEKIPKMVHQACCPTQIERNTPNFIEWWMKNGNKKTIEKWKSKKAKEADYGTTKDRD